MIENSEGRMVRWNTRLLNALVAGLFGALALTLAGCSSTKEDPSSDASLNKLYKEAKEDLDSGSYDRAIKSFEKIEGRAAGTVMSQQATL